MEVLIFIILFFAFIGWLNNDSSSSDTAYPPSIGHFEMSLNRTTTTIEGFETPKEVIEIKCKGMPPVHYRKRVGTVVSLFDVTEGDRMPVLSLLEGITEPETTCYQHKQDLGYVEMGYGYSDWLVISNVFPELLHLPKSGNRKLEVQLRLIDWDQQPKIMAGFVEPMHMDRVIWDGSKTIDRQFDIKGYKEEKDNRLLANEIIIKIGVAVAMSDGSLDPNEGEVIKGWIKKTIGSMYEGDQERYKDLYNKAFKDSFNLAKTGDLLIAPLLEQLKELEMEDCSYSAVEVAYKIMAADGIINASESDIMNTIVNGLDLEKDEVEKIRDRNVLGLDQVDIRGDDLLNTLGIDPNLDSTTIKQNLSIEFQKWNNRLNIVSEDERDEVQNMLDKIAFARKEYD